MCRAWLPDRERGKPSASLKLLARHSSRTLSIGAVLGTIAVCAIAVLP